MLPIAFFALFAAVMAVSVLVIGDSVARLYRIYRSQPAQFTDRALAGPFDHKRMASPRPHAARRRIRGSRLRVPRAAEA